MATQESETNNNNTPIHFTSREKEVLYCLARGESNPEIATTLGIDERTVRQHLENIRKKVGLCSGRKLQAWAWQNGYGNKNGLSGENQSKISADPPIGKQENLQ